jgi:hypothetical protein
MPLNAQQAHARAKPGQTVIGWKLDRDQRRELLLQFPPRFSEVVADHVTFEAARGRGFRAAVGKAGRDCRPRR